MSTINYLPGIAWSSQAAAADALDRLKSKELEGHPPVTDFIALWVDSAGVVHWSKTSLSTSALAALSVCLQVMAIDSTRKGMLAGDGER